MAERNIRITRIANQRSELFSSPVPDPESLERYESINPGFYLGQPNAARDIAVIVIVSLAGIFLSKRLMGK